MSKFANSTSCVLVLLLAGNTLFGQASLSKFEQDLAPFIGEWQGEYQLPNNGPKGSILGTADWVGSRSYVRFKWMFQADGAPSDAPGLEVITLYVGFNGKTQAPHCWVMGLDFQASGPATITENKLTMVGGGAIDIRGKARSSRVEYEVEGDTLTARQTEIVVDGKKIPDEKPIVVSRKESTSIGDQPTSPVSEAEQPTVNNEKLLEEIQGEWRLDQTNGRWTTKTIEGNKDSLIRYEQDGSIRAAHRSEFQVREHEGVKVFKVTRMEFTEGPQKGLVVPAAFLGGGYVYTVDGDTWTEAQGLMTHSVGKEKIYHWKRVK